MSGEIYTYSAEEVQVVVGGQLATGYADGTFLTVRPAEARYTKVVGADGLTSRARSANRSGQIVLTLKQTSPFNDIMTGYMLADEAGDQGVFPVLVRDNKGRTLHFAASAWVETMPEQAFGKTIENREWVMDCGRIDSFVGGNATQRGSA